MLKGAIHVILLNFAVLFPASVSYAQSNFDSCNRGEGNIFNATLIIPAESVANFNGTALSAGSKLAVFRVEQGNADSCMGITEWTGLSDYVTIWADDPSTTEQDGLREGDQFEIRVYDSLSEQVFSRQLIRHEFAEGDAVFGVDDIYVLKTISPTVFEGGPIAEDDQFTLLEDEESRLDILANDYPGVTGQFTILGLSASKGDAILNENRDAIIYTPEKDWSGSVLLTYAVRDSELRIDGATARIQVLPVNDAPTISGSPDLLVSEAELYAFIGRIEDIDGDQMSVAPVLLPDWLTLGIISDSEFLITGKPGISDIGTADVQVQVSDGDMRAFMSFTLQIQRAPSPPERPVLTMPSNQSVNVPVNHRFEWGAGGGSNTNRVQVTNSTDYAFEKVLVDQTTSDDFLQVDQLTPESSYMWRVKAENSAGESQWSRIFLFSTGFRSTSTANESDVMDAGIPKAVFLDQNYPNPFNPSTTIPFGLPYSMHVRLEVFDLLGRSQTVLVNSVLEAGKHTASWDAHLSTSGFYIYRLTTEASVHTGKLSLLK